ncbi:MAG TPA: protein-L-isoaspartate O-methyltransferase, partial [Phycisphaerae bacterium]|nr:protein-L-isoaspartate O-methyltransferase [Phycisphaerae bacterium]
MMYLYKSLRRFEQRWIIIKSMWHFGPDKSDPAPNRATVFPPFAHIDDSPDDRRRREQMIQQQIVARSISNQRVLGAMSRVPRHLFLDPDQRAQAYTDQALPSAHQQTISQPFIVAIMSEQLDVKPQHRVLEIGTGTGYQTAILALLAREVYTVERIEALSTNAQAVLTGLGFTNIFYLIGDGSSGWAQHAP